MTNLMEECRHHGEEQKLEIKLSVKRIVTTGMIHFKKSSDVHHFKHLLFMNIAVENNSAQV